MSDNMDKLTIEITTNVGDTADLEKLVESLTTISEAASKIQEISNASINKLGALATNLNKLSKITGLSDTAKELANISKISRSIDGMSGKMQIVRQPKSEAVESDITQYKMPDLKVKNLDSTVNQLKLLADITGKTTDKMRFLARQTHQTYPALSNLASIAGNLVPNSLSVLSNAMGKLRADAKMSGGWMKSLSTDGTTLNKVVVSLTKKWIIFSGILGMSGNALKFTGRSLSSLGKFMSGGFIKSLQNITGKMSAFTRSLARIAMYRAVRLILGQFTKGAIEGTKAFYEYSKVIGLEFGGAIDKVITSMNYFNNSMGAMIAPFLEALAPAIDIVIDKIVALLNAINMLSSKLMGKGSWSRAIKVQKEYAGALGASKSAQDRLTGSIDELNILSEPSGGGADLPDYGAMFETIATDMAAFKWADEMKENILAGDWAGAGEVLGGEINKMFAIANFDNIGLRLGTGIQNGIEIIYTLLSTIDFEMIGSTLASGLNSLFDSIDFGMLGSLFAIKFNILTDFIYGVVNTFNWKSIGLNIANFINGWFDEIDFNKMGQTISTTALSILTMFGTAISNIQWSEIGGMIGEGLANIEWVEVLSNLGESISNLFSGILDSLISFVTEMDWNALGSGIGAAIASINWLEILGKIITLVALLIINIVPAIFRLLKTAWEGFETFLIDLVFGFIEWSLDHLFTFLDNVKEWALSGIQIIVDFFVGIWDKTSEWVGKIKKFFIDGFDNIVKGIKEKFEPLTTFLTGVFDNIKAGLKTFVNGFISGIEFMINKVISGFNGMINALNKLQIDVPDWIPLIGGKKFGFNLSTLSEVSIKRFEKGGYPDRGDLFIANEGLPEMVGSMNNRPTVANNAQIVDGIKQGVKEAMEEVMSRYQNEDAPEININNVLELDGETVYKNQQRVSADRGANFGMGVFAR